MVVAALLALHAHPAATPPVNTVAVIDFRTEELGGQFRERFETLLARQLERSGKKAVVEYRRATLPRASFDAEIRSLEAKSPSIYYATTTTIAKAIRRINSTVPIVFSGVLDPRAAGLVDSIEHPGNNMTGFVVHEDIEDKRLELLSGLSPHIRRIGAILLRGSAAEAQLPARLAFAERLGIRLFPLIFGPEEDASGLGALIAAHRLDAIDVPTSLFARTHHAQIIGAANAARIPASFRSADFVERGALLSYEPKEFDYPHKAAQLIARILQGANPSEIPVEFPSEFVLAINVTTAVKLPFRLNKGILKRANKTFR